MKARNVGITLVAATALSLASGAAFANVYDLNINHCTGGCASTPAPFATVTVAPNGANLNFTVQLLDSLVFQKSTAFDAFAFGFTNGVATVTNIVGGPGTGTFTSSPTSTSQDGFGTFKQGLMDSATGGTTVSFTVLNETIANLALSTLPPGDTPALFAADVMGTATGNTGNIGGGTLVATVPEPSTWAMMLLGFFGLGFAFRQSRRKVSFA